jgi:hypothetical protein
VSVSADAARRLALALPEAVEQDHHGRPSFRVGAAIFATLWDERTLNAMLDEDGIRSAVHALPAACSERFWGTRLSALRIDLGAIGEEQLAALLRDAWEHRAPARLTRAREG